MLFSAIGKEAHAQLDLSGPSLDSSRYKVRTPESRRDDDIEERPGTLIPEPVTRPTSRPAKPTPPKVIAPVVPSPDLSPVEAAKPSDTESVVKSSEEHPPVTVQVRELIFGGREEDIQEYRAKLKPDDSRHNIVQVGLAPAYFYLDSSSPYSYRDYTSSGPGFGLSMNAWLSPFFGLQSRYFSSVSSGVRDTGKNVVAMESQEFEAGVRFRKHFGYSLKAATLSWGLDYHDTKNKIGREASTVVGRKTSGLSLALEATLPSSATYAHTLELGVRPSQHHSEMQTAVQVKSGNKSQTNAVRLGVGGQWTLDRQNQIFWKGQYSVERNLFEGRSSLDDVSGERPDGVSVTNSLLIFYFGFRWGA